MDIILENKVIWKLMLSKMSLTKKWAPRLTFFNEKKYHFLRFNNFLLIFRQKYFQFWKSTNPNYDTLQRTGDPGQLTALRPHLDHLAAIAIEVNDSVHDWTVLAESLSACCSVVSGLLAFITLHSNKRLMFEDSVGPGAYINIQ